MTAIPQRANSHRGGPQPSGLCHPTLCTARCLGHLSGEPFRCWHYQLPSRSASDRSSSVGFIWHLLATNCALRYRGPFFGQQKLSERSLERALLWLRRAGITCCVESMVVASMRFRITIRVLLKIDRLNRWLLSLTWLHQRLLATTLALVMNLPGAWAMSHAPQDFFLITLRASLKQINW
jgi:hypothetical protein